MQLILGDCLDVLPTLPDKSVNAIITDLPYGTTACKWDTVIPFEPMWAQVKRLLKPRGVFVTTASQPFTSRLVMSNLDWFKYEWIWKKDKGSNPLLANIKPLSAHENILVFYKYHPIYNPQFTIGKPYNKIQGKSTFGAAIANNVRATDKFCEDGRRFPISVISISRDMNRDKDANHPTQKPVALYEYLIKTYTNAGDTVLDFCCGSGTTGVACVQTGRDFIGVELDPTYFAIAQRRIAEAQPPLIV